MLDVFLDYLQRHDPAREIAPAAWLRFAVAALTHAYAVLRPRYINAISDRLLHDTKSVLDQFWIALESPNGASRWKSALSRIDALRADAAPNEGVRIGAGAPGWRLLLDGLAHAARAGRASDPTHEAISAAKSAELAVRCWAQETAAHAAWRAATPDTPWPTAAPEQAEAIAKLGAGRLGAYEPLVRAEERFHERSLDRVRSGDLISYAEATRLDPESRLAEESISTAEPARLSEPIAPRLAAQSKSPQNLPRRSRMVDVQLQHVPLADMRSVPRRWQLNFTTAAVTHAFTVLRPHLGDWLRGATLEGVLRIIDEHWHADEQDRSIESPDYVNHPQRVLLLLYEGALLAGPEKNNDAWRWLMSALESLDVARFGYDPAGDRGRFGVQQAFLAVYHGAFDLYAAGSADALPTPPSRGFTDDERASLNDAGLEPLGDYTGYVLAEVRFQQSCFDLARNKVRITQQEAEAGFET